MLGEGRSYIFSNPNLATFPGIAIFLTVIGFNLAGDGLARRARPDPRPGAAPTHRPWPAESVGYTLFRDPTRIAAAVSPRAIACQARPPTQRPSRAGQAAPSSAPKNVADADELRGFYRQMLLIRRFEEKTAEMYTAPRSAATATSTWAKRRPSSA